MKVLEHHCAEGHLFFPDSNWRLLLSTTPAPSLIDLIRAAVIVQLYFPVKTLTLVKVH